MNLNELQKLYEDVHDENLDQRSLELFRDKLIQWKSSLNRARAELKKAQAIEMISMTDVPFNQRKLSWDASDDGQRLIDIESYKSSIQEEIDGLKDRIWGFIRQA
jgi:hypothetical protein